MMMRFLLVTALAALASGPLFAQANTAANEGSIEQGKQLFQTCTSCHGQQGEGNEALGAPPLAGQLAGYLERAMAEFVSGTRGKEDSFALQMSAMAGLLKDSAQRKSIQTYLSSLAVKHSDVPTRSSDKAYRLYQASCGGCHGVRAEGNKALSSPRLAGMSAAYVKRQLEHFRSAKRGPGSRYGKQMQMMANTLKGPEDIEILSQFISTL